MMNTNTVTNTDPYLLPWSGRPAPGALPPYITAAGRDLRVDLLRGFFVFAMIVDHVRGASPLYLLTGGNRFFVSAAEGFILTSGLMVGLIYRRIVARDGLAAAAQKAWARALSLYLLTVGLTLVLLPLSELAGLPWAQGVDLTRSLELVVSVLTLHRTYYLTDVLLLYTLLFALVPLMLLLLSEGKGGVLLALSWALWGVHQLFPEAATAPWPIAGNYLFTFSAWQLLFVNALVLGYQRDRVRSLTRAGVRRLHLITGGASLILLALFGWLATAEMSLPGPLAGLSTTAQEAQLWLQEFIFGKADLRVGRLAAAAIVFTFFFLTLTRYWRPVQRVAGWLLLPLGQNSLDAFTAHIVVVVVVALALQPFGLAADSPAWLNAVVQIVSVLLIWIVVQRGVLEPTPKTRPVLRVSPAFVALLTAIILPWLPANPSLAQPTSTAVVSDAILARARAYGTPVVRLSGQAAPAIETPGGTVLVAGQFGAASASETPVAGPAVRTIAIATSAPADVPGEAASGASLAEGAAAGPVVGAQPTATPAPTALRVAAPAPTVAVPTPVVTPAPTPISKQPVQPTDGLSALKSSVQQVVTHLVGTKLVAASPSVQPVFTDPLPPLPGEDERLRTDYIGPLAGSIYARTFHSDILQRDMPYWIYLPPGYGQTSQRYPVLYMLHGGGGWLDEWAALGLFEVADQAIQRGTLTPMIIVLPQGDKSYWANWVNNSQRWGDYLAYEVVGHIDAAFGTIRDRSARAIGGLSMGAWGALHQAFTHPDIFGIVGAHSPSLYPDDNNLKFLGVGAEFASKDPAALARTAGQLDTLSIWIDIGSYDPWLEATTGLHTTLVQRGIAHEWHVYEGYHASIYWAEHIPDYLEFYGRAFEGW